MTKLLCITILILTVFIFGANHYAARNAAQSLPECKKCDCNVKLVSIMGKPKGREPSCSVVFIARADPNTGKRAMMSLSRVKEEIPIGIYTCAWTVFCDNTHLSQVVCTGLNPDPLLLQIGRKIEYDQVPVNPETKCSFQCLPQGLLYNCDHWERPTPTPPPKKKTRGSGLLDTLSMSLALTKINNPFMADLLPVKYSPEPFDNDEEKGTISGSTQWRPIGGEAGIEKGMLTVATGEAEARSFCTGNNIRLAGPGTASLPSCDVDLSGSWWGGYARRSPDYESAPVTVNLTLRKEAAALRGELTTSDGVFDVVSISRTDFGLDLQASRPVAGKQQKILLHGKITKGEIVFGGSEQSPSNDKTYALTGVLKRLYIADDALPAAAVNQPYSFALVALSPTGNPVSFRLTNPAPKQPEQITWATEAQSLRGRNGERFTYLCPPNGSLNRLYSRDNAYTDTSSICTAAVNAHVITQEAGGVVSIEIRPGPSPDTGRFVFVSSEPQGGTRGRLPQGVSFDNKSGAFSGTPTEPGSFEISVVADDGAGNVFEQPLTLTVRRLILTNGWLPDAFVGSPYRATLKVAGGQPTYRFSGVVPNGLQLDPNTGELSGTPTSTGSGFEVTIRDRQDNSETQKVTLRVRGTTILTSYFLAEATEGMPYHAQLQATGNSSPIRWSVDKGDLSLIGLTLNQQTGELSGTPTRAGAIAFAVRAQAADGHTRSFALTVK